MSSNKTPTDLPDIYRVGMKNGQSRLWCGKCSKFLSDASGGAHTCDPNWRKQKRGSSAGAGGARKRRWRLTPRRLRVIKELIDDAARYKLLRGEIKKQAKKSPTWVKKVSGDKTSKTVRVLLNRLGL